MRKILILVIALVDILGATYAEDKATYKLPDNYGYVTIRYLRDKGVLALSSQTEMNTDLLAELSINVTCTHKWKEDVRGVRSRNGAVIQQATTEWKEETFVICDETYTNIPINKTIYLDEGITNPPQDTSTDYYTNFQVYINSPICDCSK